MTAITSHAAGFEKRHKKRKLSPRPNPYAVCQVVRGNGLRAVLINCGKPDGFDIERSTCPSCRIREYKSGVSMPVAYAYKDCGAKHCDECEGDRIALIGIELERQGIELGWGYATQTKEYERESHQRHRAR